MGRGGPMKFLMECTWRTWWMIFLLLWTLVLLTLF